MNPGVTINKQVVPWSFIRLVHKALGNDWDATIDLFWKSRNAQGENGIIKYVKAGFKPDAKGNKYAYLPSKERNEGRMQMIRDWWNGDVYSPKNAPKSLAEILGDIAAKR